MKPDKSAAPRLSKLYWAVFVSYYCMLKGPMYSPQGCRAQPRGRGVQAMAEAISSQHPLRRWFSGLVESAMYTEVGTGDPALVDYLSDLLTDFIHTDRICALHDESGRPIDQISDMLAQTVRDDPNLPPPSRQRL